jgi:uncharacterized paraquat-inducible protein A
MALITCPDCNNQVSDEAEKCPKCGRPIAGGFMGRGPTQRALNFGCLIVVGIAIAFGLLAMCGR